jgi:hypothetical protein
MCVLECGTILIYYGIPGFLVAMTVAGVLIRSTKRGAFVNPAKVIEAALFGGVPYVEAPIRIGLLIVINLFIYLNMQQCKSPPPSLPTVCQHCSGHTNGTHCVNV